MLYKQSKEDSQIYLWSKGGDRRIMTCLIWLFLGRGGPDRKVVVMSNINSEVFKPNIE